MIVLSYYKSNKILWNFMDRFKLSFENYWVEIIVFLVLLDESVVDVG